MCRLKSGGTVPAQAFELCIYDIQIDNYADAARMPVLLHSAKRETISASEKGSESDLPLLHTVIVMETHPGSFTSHFDYIGARLLELVVLIDSGTLEQIICDLQSDMDYISWDEALATTSPEKWMNQYDLSVFTSTKYLTTIDVYMARRAARANKMYFGSIMIHPVKISLTFQKSSSQRRNSSQLTSSASYWLEAIPSIISVDRMPFKLQSFIVKDALESSTSLMNRITSKTMQDIQKQGAMIAGSYLLSLSVLGRPAGLVKNIGGGVQDFFYEPYEGALQSPKDFVVGLGKGTTGLVTSVVSGALNSTSSIVGSASDSISRGLSFLSSDKDYTQKRHSQRQQRNLDIARGGAVAGLKSGGETMVSGFASGLAGLVYTPVEEAKKGGALGFMKGVGLGVIGAAVKPVIGVTDGIASITQGISNTVSNAQFIDQVRPPRALERLEGESNELVLVPLDLHAATAQAYIMELARKGDYKDNFYGVVCLPSSTLTAINDIILSHRHVIWRRPTERDRIYIWSDISHITIEDSIVYLILYGTTKEDVLEIDCQSLPLAKKLYNYLYYNVSRMGNPGACIAPEEAFQMNSIDKEDSNEDNSVKQRPDDEYPFGTINGTNMGNFEGTDEQLLSIAKESLANVSASSPGQLDEEVWRIISNWNSIHRRLQSIRCCVVVIINRSVSSIQITRLHMREGRSMVVIPAIGYDTEHKTLMPGGCVVVFAYALRPSVFDKAHIKFDVFSTAFTATMATRVNRTECQSLGSFSVGFLEKSLTDWWAKYVLVVR